MLEWLKLLNKTAEIITEVYNAENIYDHLSLKYVNNDDKMITSNKGLASAYYRLSLFVAEIVLNFYNFLFHIINLLYVK